MEVVNKKKMSAKQMQLKRKIDIKGHRNLNKIMKNWQLYILILPALIYFIIFCYGPMYGVQIAFKDFIANKGIWGSPWVGLKHFKNFFQTYSSRRVIWNTLSLSVYSLIAGFPMPIILALMLNEVKNQRFKKIVQNVTYAPHFISTVVMVGIILIFFSPTGIINQLGSLLGIEPKIFLGKDYLFRHIYVWTGVWQGMGWGSIIYLAALSGIDPQLHEAATVDGASRLQRVIHINIPGILPTIIIMLILNVGGIMSVGFEKAFLMQNSLNLKYSEIISTYVYKTGLINANYSFSAAVNLFNTVINLLLLISVNKISKTVSDVYLW